MDSSRGAQPNKFMAEGPDDTMAELKKALALGGSASDLMKLLDELGISREEIEAALAGVDMSDIAAVNAAIQNLIREKAYGLAEDMGKHGRKIGNAAKGAASEGKTFADNAEKLGTEIKHVIHVAENHAKDFRDDIYATDDDLSAQMDELDAKMDALKDRLRGANDDVIAQMDLITDQMHLINDTSSDGLDRLEEKINDPDGDKELSDYYDDMSDTEDTAQGKGKVIGSVNEGEIISDINGGGIVGLLDVELNAESDFEIVRNGDRSLDSARNAYGTVLNCKNNNEVTVKNDYAGGIVGRAELGAVVGCQNYGDVTTIDGDYAGGIAGKSSYLIRGSYALCNINSNNYAGGIVGEGKDIRANYAMTSIFMEDGEKFGAIAGDADGRITGNYFVDDGMAAVNGLTYGQQATPVSYAQLVEMDTTPPDFSHFKIRFMAEDKLMKEITCGYGDSLQESQIPSPPEKDGILGTWDKTDFSDIRRNMIVRAVYGDWTTALSWGGDVPKVLISAQFHPDTVLECRELETGNLPQPVGYQIKAAYSYRIQSGSEKEYDKITVHVLAQGRGNMQAAVSVDGKFKPVKSKRDGRYLVFETDGAGEGEFAVLVKEVDARGIIAAVLAAAAVVLLLLMARHRKKRRKNKKSALEEMEDTEVKTEVKSGETEERTEEESADRKEETENQ